VTALPIYHIFSLVANCLMGMKYGVLNVLITNPRDMPAFDAAGRRRRKRAIGGGGATERSGAERGQAGTGVPRTEG